MNVPPVLIDALVVFLVIIFFAQGWNKGLLRSLIGPVSLIVMGGVSMTYFRQTSNLIHSLLIGILGPVILSIACSVLLQLWHKFVDRGEPAFWLSRLLGGVFSLAWGMGMLFLCLILLMLLPLNSIPRLRDLKENIATSLSYTLVNKYFHDIQDTLEVLQSQTDPEALQSHPEFEALQENEKIQAILSDNEIMQQIRNQDIPKLLANPKIVEVLQDEQLMNKFISLHKLSRDENPSVQSSAPKVYEFQVDQLQESSPPSY
jgi:uncharacterized membrane protein required for colicin V production